MGTTYRVPPTVDTPAEPARSGMDWASRDRYGTAPIDPDVHPDAPARGRHTVPPGEHLIGAEERLTFGEEESAGELYPRHRARVSLAAELGLIFGLLGILAALTGALAPIGLAAGGVGLLFGFAGLATTGRPYVASRPLAVTGLLLSLGALVLAWLAMNGDIDWLSRDDQAGWLRDWLDARFPWLENW